MGLGVSAAEESGGLSCKKLGISAAKEYWTEGLSCRRIWGSQQQQRGLSCMQGFKPCSLHQLHLRVTPIDKDVLQEGVMYSKRATPCDGLMIITHRAIIIRAYISCHSPSVKCCFISLVSWFSCHTISFFYKFITLYLFFSLCSSKLKYIYLSFIINTGIYVSLFIGTVLSVRVS